MKRKIISMMLVSLIAVVSASANIVQDNATDMQVGCWIPGHSLMNIICSAWNTNSTINDMISRIYGKSPLESREDRIRAIYNISDDAQIFFSDNGDWTTFKIHSTTISSLGWYQEDKDSVEYHMVNLSGEQLSTIQSAMGLVLSNLAINDNYYNEIVEVSNYLISVT